MIKGNKIIGRKIFSCLLGGILIISVFYVYFVNAAVGEIFAKKHNLSNLQNIRLEYQQMEENYFDIIGKIDMDYALSLGFVSQEQNDLIVRSSAVVRLDSR